MTSTDVFINTASTFLGGFIALVGVYFTNRSSLKAKEAEFSHERTMKQQGTLRERGEELYELVENWANAMFSHYLVKNGIMKGDLTYNEGLDLEINNNNDFAVNFARLEMLIDVYFFDTRPEYDQVISHRTAIN